MSALIRRNEIQIGLETRCPIVQAEAGLDPSRDASVTHPADAQRHGTGSLFVSR